MKMNFKYLTLVALALVACKPDVEPGFNDNDAFVSFDKSSVTIAENNGSVSIPVTLASVSGIETTISYEAIDGTAKAGTNFELADGAATLTFNEENRTQYIVVNINDNPGVFTGDLKFSLSFKSSGDVAVGAENTCVVTISDLDHPLSHILNTYTASKTPYFSGRPSDFEITIYKDADDVSKVWIGNLDPYFAASGFVAPAENYFYGIVNEDKTKIVIPKDQPVGYQDVVLVGFTDPEADGAFTDVVIEISADGNTLTMPNAFGVVKSSDMSSGWFNLYTGPIVFTKK